MALKTVVLVLTLINNKESKLIKLNKLNEINEIKYLCKLQKYSEWIKSKSSLCSKFDHIH